MRLKRVGGLAKTAMILVGVGAVAQLMGALLGRTMRSDADNFLAGEMDNEAFVEAIAPYLIFTLLQSVLLLVTVVIVIIWMFRIASNHRTMQRADTWAPGWAIGGWVLPPLLYIIPFLMFREMWKASDPDVPPGGDWKSSTVSPVVGAWFVCYSILPLIGVIVQGSNVVSNFGGSERQLAEQLTDGQSGILLVAAISVLGAVAFIAMARGLTDRHRRLTGEARN